MIFSFISFSCSVSLSNNCCFFNHWSEFYKTNYNQEELHKKMCSSSYVAMFTFQHANFAFQINQYQNFERAFRLALELLELFSVIVFESHVTIPQSP